VLLVLTFACTGTAAGHSRQGLLDAGPYYSSHRQLEDTNITIAKTPLELCEADCACDCAYFGCNEEEEEECKQTKVKYQENCTCTEQPDGSAVEIFYFKCLMCVNGTDVCSLSNVTATVKVSAESGAPEYAGFCQGCEVIEGNEFCMSMSDQSVPSPIPCTLVVNGVECNSCMYVYSDDSDALELNCTNIEEGASGTMHFSVEVDVMGWEGSILEDLAVFAAANFEDEFPLCPGDPDFPAEDDSSGARQ
jgi:hypothetical protein